MKVFTLPSLLGICIAGSLLLTGCAASTVAPHASAELTTSAGLGDASQPAAAPHTGLGDPSLGEVEGVEAIPSDSSVYVRWTANPTQQLVQGYHVYYRSAQHGGEYLNVVYGSTEIRVSGLQNGQKYLFRVAAFRSNDEGYPGDWSTATPLRFPDAPAGLYGMTSAPDTMTLYWLAPRGASLPVERYTIWYRINDGDERVIRTDDATSHVSLTGLSVGDVVTFRVSADCYQYWGVPSRPATAVLKAKA